MYLIVLNLYLLIKEVRFLPNFFVRFKLTHIYQLKLHVMPPLSHENVSLVRKKKISVVLPILPGCHALTTHQPMHFSLLHGPAI
jgi:hypothetical protein